MLTARGWRTLLMIGALAGLCFSVGEGLRLTPFPSAALAQGATPDARDKADASAESSARTYGPLDKPSQSQLVKRGKRQSPDCACPPRQNAFVPFDHQHGDPCPVESVGRARLPYLHASAGRAPPRAP